MNTPSKAHTLWLPRQLSARDIIVETIRYYRRNPRALSGMQCVYRAPLDDNPNHGCAVGRCFDWASFSENLEIDISISREPVEKLVEILGSEDQPPRRVLDSLLRYRYRGHSLAFWHELQMLHDTYSFWHPDGEVGQILSPAGRVAVRMLLREFHHGQKR